MWFSQEYKILLFVFFVQLGSRRPHWESHGQNLLNVEKYNNKPKHLKNEENK